MPLPTIDQLKHQHSIQSVNTGRQFTIPSGRPGIVADDREKLLAMTDQEGLLVFRSGVEFPLWTFRGQKAIHSPCVPGIARCDGLSQQFLAWCRNVAFVDALLAHPYVRHCRQPTTGMWTLVGSRYSDSRRSVAHGLLDDDIARSLCSLHAWCWILRLVNAGRDVQQLALER